MQRVWIHETRTNEIGQNPSGQEKLYYSDENKNAWAFGHPFLQMIFGIHEIYPEKAHRILRNRIHYTGNLGEWEKDWVKTGAKRAEGGQSLFDKDFKVGEKIEFDWEREEFLLSKDLGRSHADRKIEATLTFLDGSKVRGFNRQSKNSMWHAEVDLLVQYYKFKNAKKITSNFLWSASLYVDLKPCRWCSAIWGYALSLEENLKGERFNVRYKNHDSGKWAENTWFDRSSHVHQKMLLPG